MHQYCSLAAVRFFGGNLALSAKGNRILFGSGWRDLTSGEVPSKISRRSMKTDPSISRFRAALDRLRRGALWMIFGMVLLIPKVNRLRRQVRAWNLVRMLMALAGAAMLALGAVRGHALTLLVAGALLLLLALVATPDRPQVSSALSIDARARELGAWIALDGGRYIDAAGSRPRAKLFIGPDRLWALDAALQVLLEIPLQQIRAVFVEPAGADWIFRLDGEQTSAEFIYQGSFAEHLARVAEATVRSRLHRELPVLP